MNALELLLAVSARFSTGINLKFILTSMNIVSGHMLGSNPTVRIFESWAPY